MDYFYIFICVVFLVAFVIVFIVEYNDLFCYETDNCGIGNGAAYSEGKVSSKDSYDIILQKIRISSRYDQSSVYWRKSLLFSIIVLFSVLIITQKRLPNAYEMLAGFIIIYMLIFLFLNYYQMVVSKPATKQIVKATKLLNKLKKINKDKQNK
jgi:hypothetical protein